MKLTPDQIEALRDLLKKNPTTWKAVIRNLWSNSDRVNTAHEHALYSLRNRPDFDLRRMTRDFLSAAIETLAAEPSFSKPESGKRHHFDQPGRFEVDEGTGAGIALRQRGAGRDGGDLLSVAYKIPSEMLPEIVRLLNEEREALYVVIFEAATKGGAGLPYNADAHALTNSFRFQGYDARDRALACFNDLAPKSKASGGAVKLLRNGALVASEG